MSRQSKRLKKSSSWLDSSNALIQHLRENAIFAFFRFTSFRRDLKTFLFSFY